MGLIAFQSLILLFLTNGNWRFATEEKSMWRRVIMLKYGVDKGEWFSYYSKGFYEIGLWKEIIKEGVFL